MINLMEMTTYASVQKVQTSERPASKAAADSGAPTAGQPGARAEEGAIPAIPNAEQGNTQKSGKDGNRKNFDSYECETCKNRKYQDGSNDPGVSFKTPTKLSPDKAASAVRAHENEHVTREQANARRENRKVVSQSVSYHSAICPECGQSYISGGTTRTVTKGEVEQTYGLAEEEKGQNVDMLV